jgi:hypothetical protein
MPSTLGIVSSGHLDRPLWISAPPVFTYQTEEVIYLDVKSYLEVSIYLVSGALPSGVDYIQDGNTLYLYSQPDSKSSYSATFRAENSLGYSDFVISGTPVVNKITATGGTVTDYGGYRVHAFTASSNFTITSGVDDIQYAILAGGGGGASDGNGAGGGGAGGYITGTTVRAASLPYPVVVGAGGAIGTIGVSSSVFGYSAIGGGRGGTIGQTGGTGGNGGGGGGFGGSGFGSQGFNGGSSSWFNGGGGAGISAGGLNGGSNPNETGGNGGAGAATPPSGWLSSQVTRGGGGGGGGGSQGGTSSGGSGGGGNGLGAVTGGNATQGAEQYGAGGGGGYYSGAKGGSGYLWVRYAL